MNQWGHKKSQFFQFFIELRKIGNTISGYIKKKQFFLSFSSMRKNWEVQLGQNSYIQNLFVSLQIITTLKNINFESMDEKGKVRF